MKLVKVPGTNLVKIGRNYYNLKKINLIQVTGDNYVEIHLQDSSYIELDENEGEEFLQGLIMIRLPFVHLLFRRLISLIGLIAIILVIFLWFKNLASWLYFNP